jgi:hypothetical protein
MRVGIGVDRGEVYKNRRTCCKPNATEESVS